MGREARVNRGSWMDQKVLFGYPCGGSVTLPFHSSCLSLLGHELSKPSKEALVIKGTAEPGIVQSRATMEAIRVLSPPTNGDGEMRNLAKVEHASGLYVGDNRMTLAETLMDETGANWLLQVDTDIEFPKTLVESMLALAGRLEAKILAASVPLGTAYPTCAFMWSRTQPGVYYALEQVPREGIECDAIATAVCLIHRDVFAALAREHGRSWFHTIYLAKSPPGTDPVDFRYTSNQEDIAFCMRAKAAGFAIWCAHVPGLGHYKTIRLSHDDEQSKALARSHVGEGMGRLVEEADHGPV